MIKNNQKWIVSLFIGLFFMNSLTNVLAAEDSWHIAEGETLEFNIVKLENDVKVVEGTFTLDVTAISPTGGITYDLAATLEIDTEGYGTLLTATGVEETGDQITALSLYDLVYSANATALMKETAVDDFTLLANETYESYGANLVYRYSLVKLTFGYELKFWDIENDISTYTKIQRDANGFLKHYEVANMDVDGLETGTKITFKSYSGAGGGIPGYSLPIFVGLMMFTGFILFIRVSRKRFS
ncbi:MAG: hypothetical protein ACTSVZ_06635 [Promethearchaeota archaeon]